MACFRHLIGGVSQSELPLILLEDAWILAHDGSPKVKLGAFECKRGLEPLCRNGDLKMFRPVWRNAFERQRKLERVFSRLFRKEHELEAECVDSVHLVIAKGGRR